MRGHQFSEDSPTSGLLLLRKLWERLSPILGANRQRVGLAFLCLLAAKAGLLCIPFLLKALVDGLDTNADQLAFSVTRPKSVSLSSPKSVLLKRAAP